jgi:hypothetical protein
MLTRGAITFGNMYHYGTFYSGTAFQQAYEYGDKENRHPIVKIHESAINLIPTSTINSMKKENILSKSLALGFFLTPLKPNLPQEKMNEWNTWFISKCANSKGNNCYDAVLLYSKIFYKIILHKALKYKRPSPPAGFASGRVYLRLAKLFYNTIYIDKSKIDKSSSERIREKYLFLQSIFSN